MICSLATKLSKGDLELIHSLENEVGTTLLAFSCQNSAPAKISEDALKKIQDLEGKLGVSLVAV